MILGAMPAFNEEKYVAKTVLGVRQYVDEVLVVDDGSTDATGEIATALGARVIKHPSNRGYGGALQTIFRVAQELDADALIVIDSDGQHNPVDIPRLLAALQTGNDVVIGSRFIEGMDSSIPAYRKMGMKVLDTATQFAGTIKVTDSQSGFRAYGRRAIEAIRINGTGMSAASEILVQIGDHHLQVAEVPIMVDYAREDTSTYNPFWHGLSVLFSVFELVSFRKPLVMFSLPGTVLLSIGLFAGYIALSEPTAADQPSWMIVVGSVVLLLMGLHLITFGTLLNSISFFLEMRRT